MYWQVPEGIHLLNVPTTLSPLNLSDMSLLEVKSEVYNDELVNVISEINMIKSNSGWSEFQKFAAIV